jgi:long-chain acyl-CoA synthetase
VHRFGNLNDMLDAACARFPQHVAFSNQGSSITYAELDALSRRFAGYLQHDVGLLKGERVAIMLPNLLQYPVVLFGVLRAGGVVVNTNPLYTGRELLYQLNDSGASCIVVLENFAHTLEQVVHGSALRSVITSQVGDLLNFPRAQLTNFVLRHVRHMVPDWHMAEARPLPKALHEGEHVALRPVPLAPDDLAFLQYTGGTTGTPKGAMLSHANLVANVLQTSAWIGNVMREGEETAILPLPLYHVFALMAMLTFLHLGANSVLVTDPRDMAGLVHLLRHTKASAIIGVNTLFKALLNAPGIEQAAAHRLKLTIAGGMAVQRVVADKWQDLFGAPIVEGYGLTESSPIATANRLDLAEYTGSIGLPLPSTEVAILDDDGGAVAQGEAGEIAVRGPQVMRGYWRRPDDSAAVLTADGWLRTGDIGVMDPRGYVKLLDRKKDVIIVSGFKVFPNEVEDVAVACPGVLEAVAVAAADERSGEVVTLVVLRQDPALDVDTLLAHCRRNLTGYKVPKYVVFREQPLPKSAVGKILRRLVQAELNAATTAPAPQSLS